MKQELLPLLALRVGLYSQGVSHASNKVEKPGQGSNLQDLHIREAMATQNIEVLGLHLLLGESQLGNKVEDCPVGWVKVGLIRIVANLAYRLTITVAILTEKLSVRRRSVTAVE